MLQAFIKFLKKYWVEILVSAIVLALFIAAPIIIPAFAITTVAGGIVYTIAALFFTIMSGAITHDVAIKCRGTDEPEWPWFQGLTESSRPRQVILPEPLSDSESDELENKAVTETTPLLDSPYVPPRPLTPAPAMPPLVDSISDVPKRTSSVRDRIKVYTATQQASSSNFAYKHETATTSILQEKLKEAASGRINAKRGAMTADFIVAMQAYCSGNSIPLSTLFSKNPSYRKICEANQMLNATADDLKPEVREEIIKFGMQ